MGNLREGEAEDLLVLAGQLDLHHAAEAADGSVVVVQGDGLGLADLRQSERGAGLLQKCFQAILAFLGLAGLLGLGLALVGLAGRHTRRVDRVVLGRLGIAALGALGIHLVLGRQLAELLADGLDQGLDGLVVAGLDRERGADFGGERIELGDEFGSEDLGHGTLLFGDCEKHVLRLSYELNILSFLLCVFKNFIAVRLFHPYGKMLLFGNFTQSRA